MPLRPPRYRRHRASSEHLPQGFQAAYSGFDLADLNDPGGEIELSVQIFQSRHSDQRGELLLTPVADVRSQDGNLIKIHGFTLFR